MIVNKKDLVLSNGEIVFVGMNFRALQLMSQFPGGLKSLQNGVVKMEELDPESDEYGAMLDKAMDAMAYLLYALIRAGGTVCTIEECSMAIGLDDFEKLQDIFKEFTVAAAKMSNGNNSKNAIRRTK